MSHLNRRSFFAGAALFAAFPSRVVSLSPNISDVWYCPAALTSDRKLRSDFVRNLTNRDNWIGLKETVRVLKFYIEAMTPGDSRLSKDDLSVLVRFCKENNLKAGFEIGGVRMSKSNYGPGTGIKYAQRECQVLNRWVDCGGSIDYITLDNPVMNTIHKLYQVSPRVLPDYYSPSLSELMIEAVSAAKKIKECFSDTRIGVTEALGYFQITKSDNTILKNLDSSKVPNFDFDQFIVALRKEFATAGVNLDHFHIDFKYEAVLHDGKGKKLDFERVAFAVEKLKGQGIRNGLMFGAFDDFTINHTTAPSAASANESAVKNTLNYLDAFLKYKIPLDTILIDRWEPFPEKTGPASDLDTDMGLATKSLDLLLSSQKP